VLHAGMEQLRARNAVATPNVQHVRCIARNRLEQQRVIVDVRVSDPLREHGEEFNGNQRSLKRAPPSFDRIGYPVKEREREASCLLLS
jgi:hypothetical protein